MNNNSFRFEFLPNEILIDIFQYFNAPDLYRIFYNLNIHLNILLQSPNYLSLKLSPSNSNSNYHTIAPYICNLIITDKFEIDLSQFINVRRLILLRPTSKQVRQLQTNVVPNLEYFLLDYGNDFHLYDTPYICKKIFSNGFPYLKTFYLFEKYTLTKIPQLIQLTQISILKVEDVNLFDYKSILSSCLNLYYFKFRICSTNELTVYIKPHKNLKQMVMTLKYFLDPLNDYDMDVYFSCLPNLEKLSIHRTNFDQDITEHLIYDWVITSVNQYLPSLRRFKFYFHVTIVDNLTEYECKKTCNEIRECLKHTNNNRYKSELVLDLTPPEDSD